MTKDKSTENSEQLDFIGTHLQSIGYDLTPYGTAVALLELKSGYTPAETVSHIALTTLALDLQEAGSSAIRLMSLSQQTRPLLELLKNYKDKNLIDPSVWENDTTAIGRLISIDEFQEEWIEKVLSDPIAGKERLANREKIGNTDISEKASAKKTNPISIFKKFII